MTQAQPLLSSHRLSIRYEAQAHKVPTVPGATGLSPLPAPRAMKWPRCLSRKAGLARRVGAVSCGAGLVWGSGSGSARSGGAAGP